MSRDETEVKTWIKVIFYMWPIDLNIQKPAKSKLDLPVKGSVVVIDIIPHLFNHDYVQTKCSLNILLNSIILSFLQFTSDNQK